MTSVPYTDSEIQALVDAVVKGKPDEERLRELMTSGEVAADLSAAVDAEPAARKMKTLVVTYAEREGGLTYHFLQLFHASFWNRATIFTLADCAKALGVPETSLQNLYENMMNEVRPQLHESPEYRAWRRRRGS